MSAPESSPNESTPGQSHGSTFEACALQSGLLTQDDLDEARRSVRWSNGEGPDDRPPTDEQLADRLVEMGRLNPWQAKHLLDGQTKFTLGTYRIVDSLGQGGMGQVFKAQHGILGREVAIKVLPRDKSTPKAIESFTREIQALARLDHARLVGALDAGHDGNVYYLVTEYVPGTDLYKLVRRQGPLDVAAAARIISDVAEGLEHAHQHGLVHRDVKPGNVLVTPAGRAKLSDLGLAGTTDQSEIEDPRRGRVVGTPDYIAPDHIRSPWDPSPLWDIYSLGGTLYYAVTGSVPFPGGSTADKARAHQEFRPVDPRRLNRSLSSDFVELMADMMAKDPADRISSAREVIDRLSPWTAGAWSRPTAGGPPAPDVVVPSPPPVAKNEAAGRSGRVPVSDLPDPSLGANDQDSPSQIVPLFDVPRIPTWALVAGLTVGIPLAAVLVALLVWLLQWVF
jgi:serine/threonine protein kinase